jgi:hypothetical protein
MSQHPYDPVMNYGAAGAMRPGSASGNHANSNSSGLTPAQTQHLEASSSRSFGNINGINAQSNTMIPGMMNGVGQHNQLGLDFNPQQQQASSFNPNVNNGLPTTPAAPLYNMAVLANLVRTGQISMEQFNLLASSGNAPPQPQQHQQQQFHAQQQQQQQLYQQQLQQQSQQLQHQQQLQSQQRISSLEQQQRQQQPVAPQLNGPISNLPPIPPAALQAHYGAIHLARNLHQKMITLNASLASGYVGGNPAEGIPGVLMTNEQREAVTRELGESQ